MNKVMLMGRLTKDPELRYTNKTRKAVCNFTLAVDRRVGIKGEDKQTDFLPIIVWDKLGQFCDEYFRKGMKVVVSGRIQTRSWEDADGLKHYTTEVIADEAYFAQSKLVEKVPEDSEGMLAAEGF